MDRAVCGIFMCPDTPPLSTSSFASGSAKALSAVSPDVKSSEEMLDRRPVWRWDRQCTLRAASCIGRFVRRTQGSGYGFSCVLGELWLVGREGMPTQQSRSVSRSFFSTFHPIGQRVRVSIVDVRSNLSHRQRAGGSVTTENVNIVTDKADGAGSRTVAVSAFALKFGVN